MAGRSQHLRPVGDDESKPRSRRETVRTSFVTTAHWKEKCQKEADKRGISVSRLIQTAIAEHFEAFDGGNGSWDTVDEADAYDPKKFYTASQDKKGHSYHARVNLPKPLAGQMAGLVQSGLIPQFRSIEDVIRDAVMHRVKQVARMIDDGELEGAVDLAMLLSNEMQMVHDEEEAGEFVAAVQANAARLLKRQSWSELRRYLAERQDFAEALPPYFRDQLLDVIDVYQEQAKTERAKRRKKRNRKES